MLCHSSQTTAVTRITSVIVGISGSSTSLSPVNRFLKYSVWSNFEIADLDFWRGEAYQRFFDFLDQKGGFYYEVVTTLLSNVDYFSLMNAHLTAMGRCSSAQHWCSALCKEGADRSSSYKYLFPC